MKLILSIIKYNSTVYRNKRIYGRFATDSLRLKKYSDDFTIGELKELELHSEPLSCLVSNPEVFGLKETDWSLEEGEVIL